MRVVALGVAVPCGGRMAELKTTRNDASVADFLAAVPDPRRRADAETACVLLADVTGAPPEMWGRELVLDAFRELDGKTLVTGSGA